jgi:Fe-S cluster assembly iron-binding protein IscA
MLRLTSDATNHLVRVRQERGAGTDAGARLVRGGGGVRLTFTQTPEQGDKIVDASDIKVFVAPEIADALDTSVIDAKTEDGRTYLVIRATNGKSGAGAAKPSSKGTPKRN